MKPLLPILLLATLLAAQPMRGAAQPPSPTDPATKSTTPAPVTLTLDEALASARASSPRLGELGSLLDASRAEVDEARAARLPEVSVSAGYTRLSNVPELAIQLPDGNRRTLFPNIPDNWSSRLGFEVPLYTGGALTAGIEAARHGVDAAASDLDAARSDLRLEVTEAYWNLVVARARSRVLGEAIASFEAHLEDVRNRRRFGLAAANDELAVTVERDRAKLSRLRADNAAAVREADLARLLDFAPGTPIQPTESLAPKAPSTPEKEDLETLVRNALADRPERASAEAHLASLEAAEKVERAAFHPRVRAAGGYDYDRPNRRILPPEDVFRDSWDLSVAVSFDVFDGGRRGAAVSGAKARTEAARQRLEGLDRAIRLEVTARYRDLATARAAVGVAAKNLEAARENLRVASDRYREGLVPSSERLDAETALLRAGLDRTEALVDLHLAETRLDRAVGR